jgi:PiT family inorganic phosphate transporter
LVDIAPPQGTAAQSASAAVILASSHLGFALSTTHVATGSVLGSGVGRPGAHVRWRVAGRMVAAWLITLPAAAVVGAAMWWIAHLIGGVAGAVTVVAVLVAATAAMWWRSRRAPVGHHNVNDDWDAVAEPTPAAERVPATAAN